MLSFFTVLMMRGVVRASKVQNLDFYVYAVCEMGNYYVLLISLSTYIFYPSSVLSVADFSSTTRIW